MAADRQRLAQALAAEAARRKMFESIPEAAGQGLPQAPERPMGWNDYLENLSIGLGRGAVNNLEGIKGMVTSPVETLKGVAMGVTEAVRNPRMVAEALKQTGQRAMSGPLGLGEVIGENVNMMRMPKGVDKREIFIGKSAKTWNEKNADRAAAMEAVGVDPQKIWQETGTFRAPDGQWRQEISDLGAKGVFTHLPPSETRLSQVAVEHPELMEAYPDMARIQQFGLREPTSRGSYEVTRIQTDEGPKILGEALIVKGPNEQALASTGLHELQHAVQRREGFERGANPAEFKNKPIPARLKDIAFSRSMRELAIANKMRELGYPLAENKVLNLNRPDTLKKVKTYAEQDDQLRNLIGEYEQLNSQLDKYPDKYTQYVRSAGEVEARAVQARQQMTPEERMANFPLQSYDVPLSKVIVRKK